MGEFNEAQVAAIKHKKGPMLVLAGAGSGKTTVLTYRCLLYTSDAADEL